jgi:hypothetical protein
MSACRHKPARRGAAQIATDVGIIAALILTLLLVFGVDKVFNPTSKDAAESQIEEVRVAGPDKPVVSMPRLGVTPEMPEYDNIGSLLDALGEGYKYQSFPLDYLLDERKIAENDIIFLTCSG